MKNIYKKAFTLSEVLLALAVIGVLAAMVIPGISNNANKKMLTTQLKASYQAIQDLAQEELASVPSKNLKDTKFKSADILNSLDVEYKCSDTIKCWANSYNNINQSYSETVLQSGVSLKNGASIQYFPIAKPDENPFSETITNEHFIGVFYIDVNGKEKPNILGRDWFAFEVTDKGRLGNNLANEYTKEELLAACKSASKITACTTYLELNGWNMDY